MMLKRAITATLLLLTASALQAKPLPIRVWQFQDYNMEHIHRLIDMAAAAHINRIQLSHDIVMRAEQPLGKPQLAADINTICAWAHEKGIRVDMWTHELYGVPKELQQDGKADIDDPKLWEFVRGKYDRLFKLCPGLDGLVLTMHETAMSIYNDGKVASAIPPEKRVAKLIDNLDVVCKSYGKTLFVRTFSYEPNELRYIQQGLRECKSDIIVMSKCQPHDWQPYYPHNPAIGDVGDHRQIVEFDLGYEFLGLSTIPYIDLGYLKGRLDYGISKGIVGAVLRIEREKWRAVDTPNQANIDVFSKMLLSPTADPRKLLANWIADRYGEKAVPYLLPAFERTFETVNKSYFVLGFWATTNHSMISSYKSAMELLHWVTTAKWDASYKSVEQELFNPTSATLRKIDTEKDEALRLADLSLAEIERARTVLKPEDYAQLSDLFQRERAMALVWKPVAQVVYGIGAYKNSGSESDKRYLARATDSLARLTEQNKQHLINMASDYKNPSAMTNVSAALGLVDFARKALLDEPSSH